MADLTGPLTRMHRGWVPRALAGTEVLVLTETGYEGRLHAADVQAWAKAQGWKQVVCNTRPYAARNGGVAVFVRQASGGPGDGRLTRVEAQLVRDTPELGMAWVRVRAGHGEWLHICACYLPPRGSNYYTREGGRHGELSADRHWWALSEGIQEFSQQGKVLLVGDLNCRLGDRQADGGLGETVVGRRRSRDRVWDGNTGARLEQLCSEHGLVVLNGRLPGDLTGMPTFKGRGRNAGGSVIDFAVASPGLVFEEAGGVRDGCRLDVWSWREPPMRLTGRPYDHLPVTVSLRLSTVGGGAPRATEGRGLGGPTTAVRTLRWQESLREGYVDMLAGDEDVQRKLTEVGVTVGVDEAAKRLEEAVWLAAEKADTMLGKVVGTRMVREVKAGRGAQGQRPRNQWYDEPCRQARAEGVAAEAAYGRGSAQAVAAWKEYKRAVRRAQRRWEAAEVDRRRREVARDPRAFWSEYNGRKQAATVGMAEWTEYFKGLFLAGEGRGVPDPELCDRLFREGAAGQAAFVAGQGLGETITEGEVRRAMRLLRRGKAAGVEGLPPEFVKEAWVEGGGGPAGNVLVQPVVHLFNRVIQEGYPEGWRVGAICPVPKKAGATEMDQHRGIVVGPVLAKLYSLVLLGRLDEWAERYGVRAKAQFGFRRGRGTDDGAFVLNHVIEAYRSRGKPVYAVLVDFRKAYDSVDRPTLWRCLEQLGVQGSMLRTLRDMYCRVQLRVRAAGSLGEVFESQRGVKQGDPLSPLLFGLLLERVEEVLGQLHPAGGVQVGGQRVASLMYADDLVILGEDPGFVQAALDELARCCVCLRLEVNLRKTVGVVFNPCPGDGSVRWKFEGEEVPKQGEAIYLGTRFDAAQGVEGAWLKLLGKARGAMYWARRRCGVLGVGAADLQLHLFEALVRPVMDFGAAVWGPMVARAGGVKEAEDLCLQFLRLTFGVKSSAVGVVLLREVGWAPVWAIWVRRAARFWNRVVKRGQGDLVRAALVESCEIAAAGGPPGGPTSTCWAAHMAAAVRKLAERLGTDWRADVVGMAALPTALVRGTGEAGGQWWRLDLSAGGQAAISQGDAAALQVRDVPARMREGFKIYTHHRWFAVPLGGEEKEGRRFWQVLRSKAAVRRVAQLRTAAHRLAIEEGRFSGVPRANRVCVVCQQGQREDERHFVFECTRYALIRRRYADLFNGADAMTNVSDLEMQQWMNPPSGREAAFWPRLNAFLFECWLSRALGMAL